MSDSSVVAFIFIPSQNSVQPENGIGDIILSAGFNLNRIHVSFEQLVGVPPVSVKIIVCGKSLANKIVYNEFIGDIDFNKSSGQCYTYLVSESNYSANIYTAIDSVNIQDLSDPSVKIAFNKCRLIFHQYKRKN